MKTEYIVLCGSAITLPNGDFDVVYSHDGEKFSDRKTAINHGWKIRGSDDFNIGVIEKGKLISLDWMDRPVDTDPDYLDEIQRRGYF